MMYVKSDWLQSYLVTHANLQAAKEIVTATMIPTVAVLIVVRTNTKRGIAMEI